MKKILMLVLTGAILLTGCTDGEEEIDKKTVDFAKTNKEEQIVRSYDEIVENVDFSKSHIQVELKDKLMFDADTPEDVPDNLGIYAYEDVLEVNEERQEELSKLKEAEVVKLVDEYFGADVTVTIEEFQAAGEDAQDYSNVYCSLGRISFANGKRNEYDKYMIGETWEQAYPYVDGDYDEELVESKIEEFVNHFSSILPVNLSEEYRCLHFDEIFWKTSGDDIAGEWVINDIVDKDYYWIRMYCDVEQGVYFNKGETNVRFEKIGETSWPRAFGSPDIAGKLLRNRYLDAYVDIYLDENGELFAFSIMNYFEIGECVSVGDILSKEDALEKLYDIYSKNIVYEQITINEMMLTYAAVPGDTVDETGFREACLKPVWIFYLLKGENEKNCSMVMFDAVSGELIHRSDVIRSY